MEWTEVAGEYSQRGPSVRPSVRPSDDRESQEACSPGDGFRIHHWIRFPVSPSTFRVRFADTGRDVALPGAQQERMGKGAREAAREHRLALAGEFIITLGKIVHGGLAEGEEGCGGPH